MPSPYANPTSTPWPHLLGSYCDICAPHKAQTAWCKRGCSQANSTSLASPSHTSGTGPAAPAPPDRSEHHHRTGLLYNAPSCRNNSNGSLRNTRISFFLRPLKLEHPCPGISKYPSNPGSWTIPGEPILFQQSPLLSHVFIMQDFLTNRNYLLPLFHAILKVFKGIILPTHLRDDPYLKFPSGISMNPAGLL